MKKKQSSKSRSLTTPKLDSDDRKLRQLFWAARKEHGSIPSGENGASCPSHVEACELANRNKWNWVGQLLDASAMSLCGHLREAEAQLQLVQPDVPIKHTCLFLFVRASLAYLNKNHEQAISDANELLKDATLDRRGYVLSNLGGSYEALNRAEEAIKCYRNALKEDDYDSPTYALNNLGRLLLELNDTKGAIRELRRSVDLPADFVRSESWYRLGEAYRKDNNLKQAEHCYHKAIEASSRSEWYQLCAARALLEMRQTNHRDTLKLDDLTLLNWKGDSNHPEEITISPEVRAAAKIFKARETQYDKYLRMPSSTRNDELHILRGWSSAVTLIEGSERMWRGGGYFLKWRGIGIAIDPGFDFLRNFHDAGFHGREIDVVLITHNHPDHNADLKSIDDLRYELHIRGCDQKIAPYLLLTDEESRTANPWIRDVMKHRHPAVIFDHGRCARTGTSEVRYEDLGFAVRYFPVRHSPDVKAAVGFCVDLYEENEVKVRVGFTGDTELFNELPEHLRSCDILVAHISQPSIDEFHDVSARKQYHLGYRGLVELVRAAKPKVTLVGEFWAGLVDLRIDLVDGLRKLSGNASIFPTSLKMTVNLRSRKIICSTCGRLIPPDRIRVTPATEQFGSLSYVCPICMLG